MSGDNVSRSSQNLSTNTQITFQENNHLQIEQKIRANSMSAYGNVSQGEPSASVRLGRATTLMKDCIQNLNTAWKFVATKIDTRKDFKNLKSEIKELQKQAIVDAKKLENLETSIKHQEDFISEKQSEKQNEIDDLNKEIILLNKDVSVLNEKVNEGEKQIDKFVENNFKNSKIIKDIESKMNALKEKKPQSQVIEKYQNLINDFEKKIEQHSKRGDEFFNKQQGDIALRNEKISSLNEKLNKLKEKKELLNTLKNNLERDKNSAEKMKEDITSRYVTAKGSLNKLKNKEKSYDPLNLLASLEKLAQKRNEKTLEKRLNEIEKLFGSSISKTSLQTQALPLEQEIKNAQQKLSQGLQDSSSLIKKTGFESKLFNSQLKESEKESAKLVHDIVSKVIKNESTGSAVEDSNKLSELPMARYERVDKEAESLQNLVKDHPDLQNYAKALSDEVKLLASNEKGNEKGLSENETFARLQHLSEAIKLVETEFTNRQAISNILNPETLSLRKEEFKQDLHKKEFEMIKNSLNKVSDDSQHLKLKLTLVNGKQLISLVPRDSNPIGMSGSSSEARDTINYILQQVSKSPSDPVLLKEAKGILKLLSEAKGWIKDVFDQHKEILETSLKGAQISIELKESQVKEIPAISKVESNLQPKYLTQLLEFPRNSSFERNMLNTYRTMINAISGKTEGSESERLFGFFKEKFAETTFYGKQQLLKLAQEWVSNSFVNGGELRNQGEVKDQLINKINDFIESARKENSSTLNELASKLEQSLVKASQPLLTPSIPNGTQSLKTLIFDIKTGNLKVDSNDYKIAVKNFAQSLTSRNEFLLKSVNSSEFKNAKWGDKDENGISKNSPNIQKYINEFNEVSNFVVQAILDPNAIPDSNIEKKSVTYKPGIKLEDQQKESAKVMEFFIHVQNQLLSSSNSSVDFNSCMAIQGGLNSSSVGRLEKVKEHLSNSALEVNESMNKYFNNSKNFQNLRDGIQKPNTIPYLGLHLTDLTFSGESPSLINGEVNISKIDVVGNTISFLEDKQKSIESRANSSPVPLYDMNSTPKEDLDIHFYKKSLELQPRQPSKTISK